MSDREAEYRVSENDAARAARATYRRRLRQPRIAAGLLVLYAAIIALLALLVGARMLAELLIAAVIAPPIALTIIGRILVPAMARTNYRQSAALKGPMRLRWDETGFAIEQERGSIRLGWDELTDIIEADELLLLFQSDMIYNLVALEALTPDQRGDLRRCAGRPL